MFSTSFHSLLTIVTCTNKKRPCQRTQIHLVHFCLCLILSAGFFSAVLPIQSKSDTDLNACERCKIVIDSFKEGLKRTSRGKHEGGDAHWEEQKLSNYASSEIRLIEIQESLCHEVAKGKDQCHSFAEQYETELEDWFFNHLKQEKLAGHEEGSTLFEHLCNGKANACCPVGHFGANCQPCPGYPHNVCLGRGYCNGNGTREDKGNCICHEGYYGTNCEQCDKNYFPSGQIEMNVSQQILQLPEKCIRCDSSCSSSCHSAGPKGCHTCRKGFLWDEESGCVDVNECNHLETNPCKESTYCRNTVGSYQCLQCHRVCKTCVGGGADSCLHCASGYSKVGSKCVLETNQWYQNWPRYLTYLGLTAGTLVMTRLNTLLSWSLGILTTAYITYAELELHKAEQWTG